MSSVNVQKLQGKGNHSWAHATKLQITCKASIRVGPRLHQVIVNQNRDLLLLDSKSLLNVAISRSLPMTSSITER